MHNYVISNYHLKTTELAMILSITFNTLQEQMTQHVLSTGIYVFIDYGENNLNTQNYMLEDYELTKITLKNPFILEKLIIIEG